MVTNPEKWLDDMAAAGVDIFSFHVEVTSLGNDFSDFIQLIKSKNIKAGLVINPETSVESVFPYLDLVDQVTVMTVRPGFGGQKFMEEQLSKVRVLREMRPALTLQVDGGLATDSIERAARAGANSIVAGSSVFKSGNWKTAISSLRRSVEKYGNGKGDEELSPLLE